MDNLIFLEPLTPLTSRPRLPGILTSSHVSGASIASLSVRQTASQLNPRNEMWKNYTTKDRDVSDLHRESHSSDQHCRSNSIQEQGSLTATQISLDSNSDNDLPDIDELSSGIMQKNISATAGLDSDNDNGFVDIDEVLSSTKRESISATSKPNSGSVDKKVDDRTRDGSSDSSHSTEGSIEDPIILSDDESAGAESETDYSSPDVDPTAKRESEFPHAAERELADGNSFGSGTTLISDRLVTDDHQADGSDNEDNGGVVDGAKLRFSADRPRLASLGHGSVTHQASPLQVNSEITQGSTNYVNRRVTGELEGEGNVFAKGGGDDDHDDEDARSTKRSRSSTVSCNNPASNSNVSVLELQDDQRDPAQSPQLGLAIASLQQSDSTNGPLLRHRRRRDATANVRRKGPRTPAPIGLASTTPTTSTALRPVDLEEPQSRALFTAPEQEMVDDKSIDDPDDEDYGAVSDAAGSKRGGRPPRRPRKRVRWTKDTEENDVEVPPTHSLDVPHQAIAAAWPGCVQKSEELPIHGYFALKTIGSTVVYCLTFSQELLPRPQDGGQKQDVTSDIEEVQSTALVTDPNHQWGVRKIIGQKMVGREMHYRVEWKDTWMPESELAGAKELVDAFMANGGGGSRNGSGGRKRPLKRSLPATGPPDAGGEEEPKKRRGRPRKQR